MIELAVNIHSKAELKDRKGPENDNDSEKDEGDGTDMSDFGDGEGEPMEGSSCEDDDEYLLEFDNEGCKVEANPEDVLRTSFVSNNQYVRIEVQL